MDEPFDPAKNAVIDRLVAAAQAEAQARGESPDVAALMLLGATIKSFGARADHPGNPAAAALVFDLGLGLLGLAGEGNGMKFVASLMTAKEYLAGAGARH